MWLINTFYEPEVSHLILRFFERWSSWHEVHLCIFFYPFYCVSLSLCLLHSNLPFLSLYVCCVSGEVWICGFVCARAHSHGVCVLLPVPALVKAGERQCITDFITLHLVVKDSFFNVLEISLFGWFGLWGSQDSSAFSLKITQAHSCTWLLHVKFTSPLIK